MKFCGIAVSFGEFWNVKVVVFAEYALDDFVAPDMFVVFAAVVNNQWTVAVLWEFESCFPLSMNVKW